MSTRPFILPNDLDIMNFLVLNGFQYPENPSWNIQADEKVGMVDRLQRVKRIWPFIRLMQALFPSLRDLMCGFIFEEDDKPVGLANYMRPLGRLDEWMIVNVAVLPGYRRRGIARRLVEATIGDLQKRKAGRALLEVIGENLPAFNLYKELGFEPYTHSLQFDFSPETKITPPPLTAGWSVVPLPDSRWRIRYELALRATPENVQKYEPITVNKFEIPFPMWLFGKLFELISGTRNDRLALYAPGGKVAGLAASSIRTRPGGVNHVHFEVDPQFSRMSAQFMGAVLLYMRSISPNRRIEIEINGWQTELIKAAEGTGCIKRFSLQRMGLMFIES